MFKRVGALATIPVILGLVASLMVAGTVTAKPWKTITIQETSPCHFSVWYSWTSMGHGNDLKATVQLSGWESGNSSLIDYFAMTPKSGGDGILNHEFVVTGQTTAFQFRAYGFLSIPSKSQVLAKSETLSVNLVPQAPELCS